MYGLVGTYENKEENGIFLFSLDPSTGKIDKRGRVAGIGDTKYLDVSGQYVVSTFSEMEGGKRKSGIVLFRISRDVAGLPRLDECSRAVQGSVTACYVAFAGEYVVSANYHEGNACFYKIKDEKLEFVKKIDFNKKAGTHQVIYRDGYFYIPCLLLDKLYVVSPELTVVGETAFPKGSGPRHGCFSTDGKRLWIAGELDHRLYMLEKTKDHAMKIVWSDNIILPEPTDNEPAHPAAVRLSNDGRHLYISVREVNVFAVWDVSSAEGKPVFVQARGTQGDHPRDMVLSPEGEVIMAANKSDGTLTCFSLDKTKGRVGEMTGKIYVKEAVSAAFLPWRHMNGEKCE